VLRVVAPLGFSPVGAPGAGKRHFEIGIAGPTALVCAAKQDFGKVEAGFPMKILRKQKTLSRLALAGQRKPA
jgi:hypothetical protein